MDRDLTCTTGFGAGVMTEVVTEVMTEVVPEVVTEVGFQFSFSSSFSEELDEDDSLKLDKSNSDRNTCNNNHQIRR